MATEDQAWGNHSLEIEDWKLEKKIRKGKTLHFISIMFGVYYIEQHATAGLSSMYVNTLSAIVN